jgi:uncharacterized protein (TIGR02145 family)
MRSNSLFIFATILLVGCKVEEPQNPPAVITKVATEVGLNNATLNGEVTEEGYSPTLDRGFVYSKSNNNPTGSDSRVQAGFGKGIFSFVLDNLEVNTKYYFKSYAINSKGVSYGEVQNFNTVSYKKPVVATNNSTEITYFSATLEGTLSDNGGLGIKRQGIHYFLNPTPPNVIDSLYVDLPNLSPFKSIGSFKVKLNYLADNTKYYYRAFAENELGISYGSILSFTTKDASKGLRDDHTKIVEVKSKTGRIWMDRNLGASQVATNINDENAFGDLYQWGRGADGHQFRNSEKAYSPSSKDIPGHTYFITSTEYWRQNKVNNVWINASNNNLWQGIDGINNPCPGGFRIPTAEEWTLEINTWISKDINGAFSSILKIPFSDSRSHKSEAISNNGSYYELWTSNVVNGFFDKYSMTLNVGTNPNSATINTNGIYRVDGLPVRCIKD